MSKWLKAYFDSFLPQHLMAEVQPISKKVSREVSLLSALLIALLGTVLLVSFLIARYRYTPETNSLNLHPSALLLLVWGGVSAFLYYELEFKKDIFWLLPGIIIGGGFFLGLVSFAFELYYPGILLSINVSVVSTILITHILNALGILNRYKRLEAWIIAFGSLLMTAACIYISYWTLLTWIFTNPPGAVVNPLGFYGVTLAIGTIGVLLMTFLALFQLNEIESFSSDNTSSVDKLHLAANALFIVFMLYVSFLAIFAILRKGKT